MLGNFFLGGSNHKKEIKELEKRNREIEAQKKLIDQDLRKLQDDYILKENRLKELEESEKILQEKLREKDIEIKKANDNLSHLKGELNKTRAKIQELEKNPNYKNGDNLLNSLREKTK
jgi:chromosome segregation ATPase